MSENELFQLERLSQEGHNVGPELARETEDAFSKAEEERNPLGTEITKNQYRMICESQIGLCQNEMARIDLAILELHKQKIEMLLGDAKWRNLLEEGEEESGVRKRFFTDGETVSVKREEKGGVGFYNRTYPIKDSGTWLEEARARERKKK